MTAIEKRNALLGEKLVKALQKRHFEAYYFAHAAEAVKQVLELMPKGSSVSWGGSMTIRDMGLTAAIKDADYVVYDRDLATSPEEADVVYHQALGADFFITSANAITEEGQIVNIDGRGNRVAAITFGPKRVIHVIGLNKVARNVEEAISRARHTAAPINTSRLGSATPCTADGVCHECLSPACICNVLQVVRNSFPAGRHIVVLVGEDLGY